jgi:uncharacterized protein (TIGR00290 family)
VADKKKRTLLSWSSGKDSAWALTKLQQRPDIELSGLFTTINEENKRASMHGVRLEIVRKQAAAAELPLRLIEIPPGCSDAQYQQIMGQFVSSLAVAQIACIAFGDLYLEEIRRYREEKLAGTGIKPIFPLWQSETRQLAGEMIRGGLRAIVTCVDLKQLPGSFAGREYDLEFLSQLPAAADPCGENGEFHSCVIDGPMFQQPLEVKVGEIVEREGFLFADLS